MADTLKQVQMDRRQMIENNKGATESSRAALSAISGRNVLKTKTEIAKMRRNEEIAAQQNAAAIAANAATGAVTMEKAKASAAQQQDHTRRGEILSMLNMGIYADSFAVELGMPADVVKGAADRKAAEITQKKAAQAASAQAQADYAKTLKDIQTAQAQKREADNNLLKAQKQQIEGSITAFNESGQTVEDGEAAKKQILEDSGVADDQIIPWKNTSGIGITDFTSSLKGETAKLNSPNAAARQAALEKANAKVAEERGRQIENLKRAAAYYDQKLAEAVRKKEAASEALSSLEESFKKTPEGILAISRAAVDSAETDADRMTAYQEYVERLEDVTGAVVLSATAALMDAEEKYSHVEAFDEEGRKNLDSQKERLQQVKTALERELKEEDLTIEFQDGLNETIQQIDDMIAGIDEAIEYADHYEEIKGALTYKKMDDQYGDLSIDQLADLIRDGGQSNEEILGMLEGAAALGASQQYKTNMLGAADGLLKQDRITTEEAEQKSKQLQQLKTYYDMRAQEAAQAEIDQAAAQFLNQYTGTWHEQVYLAMNDIETLLHDYHMYEQFCMAGGTYDGDKIYVTSTGEEWPIYTVQDQQYKEIMKGKEELLEQQQMLSSSFHANLASRTESSLSLDAINKHAQNYVKDFDESSFENIGGEYRKYRYGRAGYFVGNYSSFYEDIPDFVKGKYGHFTEEEGKRILALLETGSIDVAFDYYATAKEQALLRWANKQNKWANAGRGVVSGLTSFVSKGVHMLVNAFNEDYARVGGDIMTASHQVTMDRLENMGIGGDALELLYMSGYSALDMAPAVAMSFIPYVGGYMSSAYTFSKVMATTYNDSIVQGKRADEALTYSVLSAAAEVTMEKILGGVGQLGSKSGLSAKLKKTISNISATKGMKTALKVASSMGSEGFEEFLQEAVSPFLQKVAADLNGMTDAEIADIDWEEAAKSFFIGAAVGGIFGGFSSINSNKNNGMKLADAEALLESGEVAKLIKGAAELGSIRAKQIMQAYHNGQALYEGKEGWFAYASPADIVNIRQSYKRRSARESLRRLKGEFDRIGTDKAEARGFARLFKKVLNGETLTTQEAAEIINHEDAKAVFEKMLGMDITMMLPNELASLARLAAFAENGKISNERLALFRDAFGELDYKALAEIIKYSDMADKKVSGIIYEDPTVEGQLTEAEQESVDVLKILSQETGMVFLVTDQHKTGDYLAAGLMAVNRNEISRGVFNSISHRAYYMAKQLLAEKGVDFKAFMLKEAKRIKGDEAVEKEIKSIQQQSAVDANDVDSKTAEDELCARMMGEILSQEGAFDRIAATDIELAEVLRKAIGAVQGHLTQETSRYSASEKYFETVDKIVEDADFRPENNIITVNDTTPEIIVEKTKAPQGKLVIKFNKLYALIRKNGTLIPKKGTKINYHGLGDSFAKEFIHHLNNPEKIILLGNGRYNIIVSMKNADGENVLISLEIGGRKQIRGDHGKVNEVITAFGCDNNYVNDLVNNPKNMVVYEKRDDISQGRQRASYVSLTVNGMSSNNSISNVAENVNQNSYFSFFDGGSVDVTDTIDQLTSLIKQKRADENGWGTGTEEPFDPNAYDDHDFTYSDAEDVRAENDGMDFAREFDDMTPEQREAEYQKLQGDIDEYMELVIRTAQQMSEPEVDTLAMVGAEKAQEKKTVGQWLYEGWSQFRRKFTNSAAAVYDIGKKIKDRSLYHYYSNARSSIQSGIYMIQNSQRNVRGEQVGESLREIWAPILRKGKTYKLLFDHYLLHLHNIDRMSRYSIEAVEQARHEYQVIKDFMADELKVLTDNELRSISKDPTNPLCYEAREYIEALDHFERLRNTVNKPVFGHTVSAQESRSKAEALEREHPEFKELAKKVYQYRDNLMQYRVDSGLISAETAAKLREIYPHYVPTARAQAEDTAKKGRLNKEKKRAQVGRTVGRATGGEADIIDLYRQFADQTMSVVREGSKNRFGLRLLTDAQNNHISQVKNVQKAADKISDPMMIDLHLNEEDPFFKPENKNVFGVFKDGELWEMEITNDLFEAVQALEQNEIEESWWLKAGKIHVNISKKLVTALNPKFLITNPLKDFADAIFTSKDTKAWAIAIPQAIREMKNNGELWQQYQALGGGYATLFDFGTMTEKKSSELRRQTIGRIEAANQAIEQIPRFAEFIATVKKGDGSIENLMEAMHNAADITTDFGRSGTWGKNINRYGIPFFNPAVQGMSKAVRLLTEQQSMKGFVQLGLKAIFFGVAPAVINSLLYSDDEEWEQIRQSDKDRYFLFKIKEGIWIRIPKGRMLSVLGAAGERARQAIEGDEVEWASFVGTTVDQMAPSNPLTSNIAGPLVLASINRTWYGTDIVNQRLAQLPDGEQYDTKTDEVSKWIGSVTGRSPKKINYVIDAYSGVVGDVLLPLLTPAAERTFLEQSFTLDTNYSNRLSEDFYTRLDDLSDNKNSKNGTTEDAVIYRWWNRNASAISEVNAEIRKIEEDTELSGAEKKEKVNEQYAVRNALMLGFEEKYESYAAAVEKASKKAGGMTEEDAAEYIYREANREVLGTEYALKTYSKSTYERAVKAKEEQGIDFDTFYEVYFDGTADVDKCLSLIEDGFEKDGALEITRRIGALEPVGGEKNISALQKYKAINEANVTEQEKLWAMSVLASDADQCKMAISADYNVSLGQFISVKKNISLLDEKATGTKGGSNAKVTAAISQTDGLSGKQKAVLWQLFTGSTSAKNNPYSVSIGWDVIAKNKAYKAAQEE